MGVDYGVFQMKQIMIFTFAILILLSVSVKAETIAEDLARKIVHNYPSEKYIIGVGIVVLTGDEYKDRRGAEILARLEIAKLIRTTVKGSSIIVKCEGKAKTLYDNKMDCRNHFEEIVEESVDEVLEGSRIIEAGDIKKAGKNMFYAIAVLPKKGAVEKAETLLKQAEGNAKVHLDNAVSANDAGIRDTETKKAREELKKAEAYDSEKDALERVKQDADSLIEQLNLLEKGRGGVR